MIPGTRAVLLGVAVAGALTMAATAGAAPNTDDPSCMAAPWESYCMGNPIGSPTSNSDPSCAMSPGDGICAGGPFAIPTPPPPPGSGLPGAPLADGMPAGSAPIGGIPGMPGSI